MNISVVDYGLGNLNSVKNMILKLGYDCEISSEYKKIKNAEKIILPGVGSFDSKIKNFIGKDNPKIINLN